MDKSLTHDDILKAAKAVFDFADRSDNEIVHDSYFGKITITVPKSNLLCHNIKVWIMNDIIQALFPYYGNNPYLINLIPYKTKPTN